MKMTIDMIPYGKVNAISREQLVRLTGLSDRDVRECISILRQKHPICSSSSYQGYFRPTEAEISEAEHTRNETAKRARALLSQLKTLNHFINGGAE